MRDGGRRCRRLGALAWLAALLTAAACGGKPGEVKGKVSFRGEGLAGITVEVYLRGEKTEGGAPFMTADTGEGGSFSLAMPPGVYWIRAKEAAPAFGPRKIGDYSLNPVRLPSGGTVELKTIELQAAGGNGEIPVPAGGGIRGVISHDGTPVEDGTVMIYGADRRQLTGPGYAALVRTGADGSFEADLSPGRYQVAARKRGDGSAAGFLVEGDLSVEYEGNPVQVKAGEYTDIGSVPLHQVDTARLRRERSARFEKTSPTSLGGMVVDGGGRPLSGQFVFIYRDQGMIGRPDHLTTTDDGGLFVFNLAEGGTYYLGARNRFGGPRQPGEMVGRLAGSPDSSVTVEQGGQVGGLLVKMEAVW